MPSDSNLTTGKNPSLTFTQGILNWCKGVFNIPQIPYLLPVIVLYWRFRPLVGGILGVDFWNFNILVSQLGLPQLNTNINLIILIHSTVFVSNYYLKISFLLDVLPDIIHLIYPLCSQLFAIRYCTHLAYDTHRSWRFSSIVWYEGVKVCTMYVVASTKEICQSEFFYQ